MKKGNDILYLTFYYLVDSRGNVFTTAINIMDLDAIIHVWGLFDPKGNELTFDGGKDHIEEFCKKNEIHFGKEEKEFHFSTTTMTDTEKFPVVNIHCWRQREVEGKPLTQPRHIKI
jgi:hypothetical protein